MSEDWAHVNMIGNATQDLGALGADTAEAASAMGDLRPRAPVEYRSAETMDVRFPERVVQVLAMPYETPTNLVIHEGRQITEVVSRGAFGHCQHRKDVRAYRGHNRDAVVGRAIRLVPDGEAGLVADLRLSKTPVGDEMLTLAADNLIDLSVCFAPIESRWSPDRTERRIDRAYLDHIAFVGDPAYPTQVLAVRSAEEPALDLAPGEALGLLASFASSVSNTPRKDAIRLQLIQMGYRPDK